MPKVLLFQPLPRPRAAVEADIAAAAAAEAEMRRDRALMAAAIRAECRAARQRNPRLTLASDREILNPNATAGELAPAGGLFARGRIGGPRRRPEVA